MSHLIRYFSPKHVRPVLGALCICMSLSSAPLHAAMVPDSYALSLEQVTELALKNNFDVQLAKYDAWMARTGQDTVESIFDTIFQADVSYVDNQMKPTSSLYGNQTVTNNYDLKVSKKTPTGTTLSVNMDNSRNWTDSSASSSPLTHDSSLGLSVQQDLGKNFFGLRDRGSVNVSRVNIENAEYTSLNKIELSLSNVQKAYWSLILNEEQANIERGMVQQAKKLFDLHQEKLKDGLVEKPEAIASEANYKYRFNQLELAENLVKDQMNELKLLMNIDDLDIEIKPTQNLSLPEQTISLKASMAKAFENRRDYKIANNQIKVKKIELAMKKNNLWPEINLNASLEKNGLGDHFKQAVTRITSEDNTMISAGFSLTFPLENNAAKAEYNSAKLDKAKALISVKYIERQIAVQLKDQVRDCKVYRSLALNSIHIAELQSSKLKEEEKRFNQGRSDTDTLIRFQEDVIQAQLLAAQAKYRYLISLVDLEYVKGTLLDKYWEGNL